MRPDVDSGNRSMPPPRSSKVAEPHRVSIHHKTKMCKFFLAGTCARSTGCSFAHGSPEMRPLADLRRTKMCPDMRRGGTCTDPNCNFAHRSVEIRRCQFAAAYARRSETPGKGGGGGAGVGWQKGRQTRKGGGGCGRASKGRGNGNRVVASDGDTCPGASVSVSADASNTDDDDFDLDDGVMFGIDDGHGGIKTTDDTMNNAISNGSGLSGNSSRPHQQRSPSELPSPVLVGQRGPLSGYKPFSDSAEPIFIHLPAPAVGVDATPPSPATLLQGSNLSDAMKFNSHRYKELSVQFEGVQPPSHSWLHDEVEAPLPSDVPLAMSQRMLDKTQASSRLSFGDVSPHSYAIPPSMLPFNGDFGSASAAAISQADGCVVSDHCQARW
eukprot:TRINITY_DN33630_c0_g1_i1.p1 TRINITY_DN33630_c0_g1~~TRINITY_DN33630_c0_g1_i1.p1  ORF type:complete len:383 (+),score=57.62 TRINITY_DN33630_c0_g1_i1:118-1266(+)